MRVVALLAGLLLSDTALAGGMGPLVMGGFHTEKVAYYSTTTDGTAAGAKFDDPSQYTQFSQQQIIGNVGAGLELVLGDRDDLIQGVFRAYWMMDFAQSDPTTGSIEIAPEAVLSNWREGLKHNGVGTVGLNFGVVRALDDKLKFSVGVHLGSGFLTTNHTEFLLAQAGGDLSYLINRTLEYYVDVSYGLRVRKDLSHGLYGTTGFRVMFD